MGRFFMKTYYAHGKLLITAEYLVLKGAMALSLPTTYGQKLTAVETETEYIEWTSKNHKGEVWFQGVFDLFGNMIKTNHTDLYLPLESLLKISLPGKVTHGFSITTVLEFPNDWGLGSSSTLTSLVSQWTGYDRMKLHQKTSNGSGYDVANAEVDQAIIYQLKDKKPIWNPIDFDPPFKDELFFVHLNQKQKSEIEVNRFNKSQKDYQEVIVKINSITQALLTCNTLDKFEKLISQHEDLLSETTGFSKIKNDLFADYPGAIKSLGAWGGDFILATRKEALSYFSQRGFKTILPYNRLIYN